MTRHLLARDPALEWDPAVVTRARVAARWVVATLLVVGVVALLVWFLMQDLNTGSAP